jgi:beta-glucanase (GH16 family)
MKKLYIILICSIFTLQLIAQSPNAFRYQAAVKDNNGVLVIGASVKFRFEIFKTALEANGGTKVYSEIQQTTTPSTGLVNLLIGKGTPESGTFSTIDWSANSYYIRVSIDRGSGYVLIGEQQMLTTSYAQFADATGNVVKTIPDGTVWGMAVDNSGNLTTVPFPKGYTKMVWNDEFNGSGLPDDSKWDYEQGYVRSSELQYYAKKRVENSYQQDGLLHLVARQDSGIIDGAMRPMSSASIITKGKAAWLYGYVEVRAKMPYLAGIGTWPAIWMMPNDDFYGGWPRSGEIDNMEYVASDYRYVHFSQHSYKYNNIDGANLQKTTKAYCPTAYSEFHTYGLQWTPETMIWYLDGVQKFKVNNVEHLWSSWPFNKPYYLLLNLAMGGWGGTTNYTLLRNNPQDYQIDYVRIFQ